ncbi:MAG TPA: hypothetical protein VHZ33_11075 [Trebonia sp.]|nr:hypothetical protein [Trebonia sp.]
MSALLTREGTQQRTATSATLATSARRGRLREACHRIRLAIQEMNYASTRMLERQAPWIVDEQWYRR